MTADFQMSPIEPPPAKPTDPMFVRVFWAIERHELVAGAADQLLTPTATQAVQELLGPLGQFGLGDIAGWADTARNRRPDPATDDPETLAFLEDDRNRRNDRWHYVNLPLGAEGYDPVRYPFPLTRDDDVVAMTAECVRVLLGQSTRMSPVNALRWVAHLVGDVHQPIHCACGYIRDDGETAVLVHDPDQIMADGLDSDRGGNLVYLPLNGGLKLHGYWDDALGADADLDPDPVPVAAGAVDAFDAAVPTTPPRDWFIAKLLAMMPDAADAPAGVAAFAADDLPPERWAEAWASDSLPGARAAYETLRISGRRGDGKFDVEWEGQAAYDARCQPIVERRLVDASRNMAALVNAIWP